MRNILLSIKPKYAEMIYRGEKIYEFRRSLCKADIERIYLYESSPVMMVTGYVELDSKVCKPLNRLWDEAKLKSGISFEVYREYFHDRENACAYKIKRARKFKSAKSLSDFGIQRAPQNFVYL